MDGSKFHLCVWAESSESKTPISTYLFIYLYVKRIFFASLWKRRCARPLGAAVILGTYNKICPCLESGFTISKRRARWQAAIQHEKKLVAVWCAAVGARRKCNLRSRSRNRSANKFEFNVSPSVTQQPEHTHTPPMLVRAGRVFISYIICGDAKNSLNLVGFLNKKSHFSLLFGLNQIDFLNKRPFYKRIFKMRS